MTTWKFEALTAWRFVLRQPLAAGIAIVGLAIGIGANIAVFSAIDRLFLSPPPFAESDRLVMVVSERLEQGQVPASYPDFADWRRDVAAFSSMGAFTLGDAIFTVGEPHRVARAEITGDLFPTLGTPPAAGRWLTAEPAGGAEVVISRGLAQRLFGDAAGSLGKGVRIDGIRHSVIGVMPEGFLLPPGAEAWTLLDPYDPAWAGRGSRSLGVLARLADGANVEQANQELAAVQSRLEAEYGEVNAGLRTRVVPLQRELVGGAGNRILVLGGAVLLLLFIACFNFAGILLAAASAREDSLLMRVVMGASRAHLTRQLVGESVLLALAGGGLGLLVARWGLRLVERLLPPQLLGDGLPLFAGRVLLFGLGLSLLTGVIVGLITALRVSRRAMGGAPTSRIGVNETPDRQRLRRVLVGAEVAFTVLLLSGTGLLLHSFLQLQSVDPGFDSVGRLALALDLPAQRYDHPQQRAVIFEEILLRAAGQPGVESVTLTSAVPLGGRTDSLRFFKTGQSDGEGWDALSFRVTESYFETLGVELIEGEVFTGGPQPPREAVVNRKLARALWPGDSPVGQDISFSNPHEEPYRVVGVVEEVHHRGLDREPGFQIYLPFQESPGEQAMLVARLSAAGGEGGEVAARSLRAVTAELLPEQPLAPVQSLDDIQGAFLERGQFVLSLLATFAVASLLLALMGVYGVVALGVHQRQREIGIRMALGASRRQILGRVVRQGLTPVIIGLIVGLICASLLSTVAAKVLYGIVPLDPFALGLALAMLGGTAMLAALLPGRRALRVDPAASMRIH